MPFVLIFVLRGVCVCQPGEREVQFPPPSLYPSLRVGEALGGADHRSHHEGDAEDHGGAHTRSGQCSIEIFSHGYQALIRLAGNFFLS